MIIAFFVIFGVRSIVSSLVGRPWSTVMNFLHRYYKRGTVENLPRTGRPDMRSLPNEINGLSCALYGRAGSKHVNKSVISTGQYSHTHCKVYALLL